MQTIEISDSVKQRIKNIEAYAKHQQEILENKRREEEDFFNVLNQKIGDLYPRVVDLISVANTCIQCNVDISSYKRKDIFADIPVCFEITDGKIMVGIRNHKSSSISMYAGPVGLCNWNGNSIHTVKDTVSLVSYIPAMKSFLNGFDQFEKDFYEYVDCYIDDQK